MSPSPGTPPFNAVAIIYTCRQLSQETQVIRDRIDRAIFKDIVAGKNFMSPHYKRLATRKVSVPPPYNSSPSIELRRARDQLNSVLDDVRRRHQVARISKPVSNTALLFRMWIWPLAETQGPFFEIIVSVALCNPINVLTMT